MIFYASLPVLVDMCLKPCTIPLSAICPRYEACACAHSMHARRSRLTRVKIRAELNATFVSGLTRPLEFRRHQLLQLARMIQENKESWYEALRQDLGRPDQETALHELGPIVDRCVRSVEQLEEWARPLVPTDVPDWQKTWKPTAYRGPKGVVLVIACVHIRLHLGFANHPCAEDRGTVL
jgi:acyl-CoA reductase-like NAD-dependent aldehyde dehydrogenase